MGEYLVKTADNSFYRIEGSGRNMKIYSIDKHSHLKDIDGQIIRKAMPLYQILGQKPSESSDVFDEQEMKSLKGKAIFFQGPGGSYKRQVNFNNYGGSTQDVEAVYVKM